MIKRRISAIITVIHYTIREGLLFVPPKEIFMGARGELFTTEVFLDNRSYFFNVKENRTGDVFLQIVESKSRDGMEPDRHQIAIFADDMQKFLQGMERSLNFVDKNRRERMRAAREKKAAKEAKYGNPRYDDRKMYRVKGENPREGRAYDNSVKKTGKVIHIVSKRENQSDDNNADFPASFSED